MLETEYMFPEFSAIEKMTKFLQVSAIANSIANFANYGKWQPNNRSSVKRICLQTWLLALTEYRLFLN